MGNIYDVAAAIQQPNVVGNFNQGVQIGQQNKVFGQKQAAYQDALSRQQQVQNLAPQIIAGDPMATEQAQAADPQAAAQYQDAATQHIKRIQGAISYIDSQKDPVAKEAAYQQVRPYLAQFGQEPPATFAEAAPKMEAARAQIAALSGQQKPGFINVAAGGALVDPTTGKPVYQNPGVTKTPGIVSVNLPDGSTQQYQQNPDGSLSPLRLAGQGAPQGQQAPQPNVQLTPSPDAQSIAADQATALVSSGVDPAVAAAKAMAMHPGTTLAFDQASGRFRDVSDGSAQFKDAQPSGMGELGRSAPKQAADDKETFGAPQQVMGADGKPHLIQFGNRGGQREVTGFLKPDMTPAQAAKQAVQQEKANASKADAVSSYDQSINQIDSLLNSPGASMLGTYMGDVAGLIPHTDTSNAVAALDNIKNQVLLNTISKLKALSATGASGFGSLSNQEGEILKNSIASLDKKQSNDQLLSNLRQIKTMLQESRDRVAGKEVTFDNGSDQQTQSNAGQVKRYNPATGMIE